MTLFGLLFYAGAGYVYVTPPTPTGDAPLIDGDIRSCTVTLQQLGHTVKHEQDELRVERLSPQFDNAERLLADASLGISACSLPLIRFCMGPGCPAQGVSFALSAKVAATKPKMPALQ